MHIFVMFWAVRSLFMADFDFRMYNAYLAVDFWLLYLLFAPCAYMVSVVNTSLRLASPLYDSMTSKYRKDTKSRMLYLSYL